MRVRAVFLDVGETLVDETRHWEAWADLLGVPRLTFLGVLGGIAARGEHHRTVFARLAPGVDVARRGRRRSARTVPADLYPDALPCLRGAGRSRLPGRHRRQPAGRGRGVPPRPGRAASTSSRRRRRGASRSRRPRSSRGSSPRPGSRRREIAYVGDRVDNDVVPAADAGMVAVHLRRGPWGHLQADWPEVARAAIRIEDAGRPRAGAGRGSTQRLSLDGRGDDAFDYRHGRCRSHLRCPADARRRRPRRASPRRDRRRGRRRLRASSWAAYSAASRCSCCA